MLGICCSVLGLTLLGSWSPALTSSPGDLVVQALGELGLTDGTPWIAATVAILTAVVVHAHKGVVR